MYIDNIDSNGQIVPNTIKRISDGLVINFDITDQNYQDYLQWYSTQNPIEQWDPQPPTVEPVALKGSSSSLN